MKVYTRHQEENGKTLFKECDTMDEVLSAIKYLKENGLYNEDEGGFMSFYTSQAVVRNSKTFIEVIGVYE